MPRACPRISPAGPIHIHTQRIIPAERTPPLSTSASSNPRGVPPSAHAHKAVPHPRTRQKRTYLGILWPWARVGEEGTFQHSHVPRGARPWGSRHRAALREALASPISPASVRLPVPGFTVPPLGLHMHVSTPTLHSGGPLRLAPKVTSLKPSLRGG